MSKVVIVRMVLAGVSMLALCGGRATAQSIDYNDFEAMFGEPVTTSATGAPQRATDAPADMTIVTQDDIRRSGADNLPDILSMVTGMQFQRTSLNEADVTVRGYDWTNNPRMLVLINGRSVFDAFFGFVPWGALPVELSEIRQIEVVRGPNSALFGFNAAAGVINIVTYDPLYDTVNTADAATGTQALAKGSAVATVRQGNTGGIQISAGGMRANEFAPVGRQPRGPDHPSNSEAHIIGHYRLGSKMELTLDGGFSDASFYGTDISPRRNDLRINYLRSVLGAVTPIGSLELNAYRNETRLSSTNSGSELNDVYDVQLSDTLKLGASHTVRVNTEFRDNASTSAFLFHGTIGYRDYVASLMWNWRIRSDVALTNAVRLERLGLNFSGTGVAQAGISAAQVNSITHNVFTFNSALVWAVTPNDTLRFIAARGIQLPTLTGLGLNLSIGRNAYIVGDPHLQPAAVTSVEVSYDRVLNAIASTLHGSVFAERNDNLYAGGASNPPIVTQGVLLLQSANTGHSDEIGVEVGLRGSSTTGALTGLRWNASYALAAINDHLRPGLPYSFGNHFARSTPRHTAIAGLGYSTGRWEFDVSARWQSEYEAGLGFNTRSRTPLQVNGFLTAGSRVGYQVTRNITISLSGEQLLRARIRETSGLQVERRVIGQLAVHL